MSKEFDPVAFRMKFRAVLAILAFLAAVAICCLAMFSEVAAKSEFTGPIIGFLLGTLVSTIITFYYGNAESTNTENQFELPPSNYPTVVKPLSQPGEYPISPGPGMDVTYTAGGEPKPSIKE